MHHIQLEPALLAGVSRERRNKAHRPVWGRSRTGQKGSNRVFRVSRGLSNRVCRWVHLRDACRFDCQTDVLRNDRRACRQQLPRSKTSPGWDVKSPPRRLRQYAQLPERNDTKVHFSAARIQWRVIHYKLRTQYGVLRPYSTLPAIRSRQRHRLIHRPIWVAQEVQATERSLN